MKLFDISDYNRAAKTYWILMVAAGVAVFAWAAVRCLSLTQLETGELAAFVLFAVVASSYPIRIPNTDSSFTAGDVFTFLALMLLGIPSAVLVGMVDVFVSSRRTSKRMASWIGAPAMMGVTIYISGNIFYFALSRYAEIFNYPLGKSALKTGDLIVCLALLALAHYFVNGLTVSIIYALKERQSIVKLWRDGYLWTWWSFLASATAAAVAYEAITRVGWGYAVLSLPIVAATFATYKVYFERVNAKTREAEELSRLHLATVEALATAIDAKDQTTHCHVRRMQIYAEGLGKLLNLSHAELAALKAGALLHDVGKLAVPDHILNKPGTLTRAEFERTKIHTIVGAEILNRCNFPYPVVPIVRHHHEHWDGSGYPDGLKGEQIPITARVLSVVDCFDSVQEDRPFRHGMLRQEAIKLLNDGTGTQYDPRVVDMFITHLPKFEAEIAALGLANQIQADAPRNPIVPARDDMALVSENRSFAAYDQIRNAHREVYALYEIARTFGGSLEVENTLSVLVDRVGHIVPFDTCVVYVFDEVQGHARATLAVGLNADLMRGRCVALGEGVTGFALANRRPVNRIHPGLEFSDPDTTLERNYQSMAALPLFKDDRLLGAMSIYSMTLREYSDDQIRLLESVTKLASDALANAMSHARAESNALTDSLTGLPNARSLQARFDEEVSRSQRSGRPFQVIMLDLDDFKIVNDTFGHKLGDRMLHEVAHLVHGQLREYDFLARYAGDEFVAILPDAPTDHVDELRERIERTVSGFSIEVRGQGQARVGISVGASLYGADGETLDQLLIAADRAMYRAKSTHKSSIFPAASPASPNFEQSPRGSLATRSVN